MTIGHRHTRIVHTQSPAAFEPLESRSMMSADISGVSDPLAVSASTVMVADDAFLNPQADAPIDTGGTTSMNDADMYDFGGVWGGGGGASETALSTGGAVAEVFGDLDAMDGRTEWTSTPADVLATRHGTREEALALRDANDDHDLPADFSGDAGADDSEIAADASLMINIAPITPISTGPRITWIGDDVPTLGDVTIRDIDLGDAALVASYV